MDELLEVMQLIDKNSDKLSEGDYLDICNRLKNVYSKRADPEFFFDYDNFSIQPLGPTREVYDYFRNYYMDQGLGLDSDYITGQMDYLRKELEGTPILKRRTKYIQETSVRHYCLSNNLDPDDYINYTVRDSEGVDRNSTWEDTLERLHLTNEDVMSMAKTYMQIENTFREKYRNAIERRLEKLEEADDKLDEL